MANYTAADVKALRERSGAGMMDCKGALDEADGNVDKALEVLRLKGLKGVTKREGRTTSNGLIVSRVSGNTGWLLELACETDFVAKAEKFISVSEAIADAVAEGLIARHSKPEAAAEPLAEWERELLEQSAPAEAASATETVEAPAAAVAVEEAK